MSRVIMAGAQMVLLFAVAIVSATIGSGSANGGADDTGRAARQRYL